MLTIERITPTNTHLLAPFPDAAEFQQSLEKFDWLHSDSFWLLVAVLDGVPAGQVAVARIPKTDGRGGFLFVDELYVRPAYRQQGIAAALIASVKQLALASGYAGVRLLVRPENAAARALYTKAGFSESTTVFAETRW